MEESGTKLHIPLVLKHFVLFPQKLSECGRVSLSLRHVGTQTKQASSYLIMSIVGGAVAPLLMGLIADRISMAVGFIVPLVCFMEIWGFATRYRKLS